jgi:hypothetical protein
MASAYLIERLKDGKPRSVILSSGFPCPHIDPEEQNLVDTATAVNYATAKHSILTKLRATDPDNADRLRIAVENNERNCRESGRAAPTMTEVSFVPPKVEEQPESND